MANTPIESLNILDNILQRLSLPMATDNNQLSHTIIGNHIKNIHQALVDISKPEESKPDESSQD